MCDSAGSLDIEVIEPATGEGEVMWMDIDSEFSAVRFEHKTLEHHQEPEKALESVMPAESVNPTLLFNPILTTVPDISLLGEPISYDPIRRIDMSINTIAAPKRFFRTFWRSVTARTLSLNKEGEDRKNLSD
jgi:hypothetical protein